MASKMPQERPKKGPRGTQDGPKSAQESPKSAPRGPEDRPKRVPEASNMSSRRPYDGPQEACNTLPVLDTHCASLEWLFRDVLVGMGEA